MLRIQLVIEDYGELISLQTMLKKLGFDVDATQNTVGLNDQLITLNPDLVILTAFGRKVAGFEVAAQIRKIRGLPHLILTHEPAQAATPDPAVAAWLPSPVNRENLIKQIARLFQMNEAVLLEKYYRHVAQPLEALEHGRLQASTLPAEERRARYQQFLNVTPPPELGFTAAVVREQTKALRAAEKNSDQADLERERREFVAQLFKKGS